MSLPDAASLEAFSLAELRDVVGRLVGEVRRLHSDNAVLQAKVDAQQVTITALRAENQTLRDEVARLKGLPPRPPSRPSGMEQATQPGAGGKNEKRPKLPRGAKRDAQAITAARRCIRERTELVAERVALVNRIGAVLATLGVGEYNPLLRNRRERLDALRTALRTSLPPHAHAKISRMLDRLDLVRAQIAALEQERDAVLEVEAPDRAGEMIQQLATLRGIGVQSATVLVREAFVREFANGKALGSYAGLCATPYSSGGTEREQGISKAGNRRLRTVMVELAWLWQRYQPGSAQVSWFRERVGGTGARMRKVMVIALARKLLIALWRFATQGVVPEGAVMKPAS